MSAQDDLNNKLAANHTADDALVDAAGAAAKVQVESKKQYFIDVTRRLEINTTADIGNDRIFISDASMEADFLNGRGKLGQDLPNKISTSEVDAGLLVYNNNLAPPAPGEFKFLFNSNIYNYSPVSGSHSIYRYYQALDRDTGAPLYGALTRAPGDDGYELIFATRRISDGTIVPYTIKEENFAVEFRYNYPASLYSADPGVIQNPFQLKSSLQDRGTTFVGFDTCEQLTITVVDTIPDLSQEFRDQAGCFMLLVNGTMFDALAGSGLTVSGKNVTWNSGTTGTVINPGDRVVAFYKSKRPID